MNKAYIFFLLGFILSSPVFGASSSVELKPVFIDLGNKASLQRGHKFFSITAQAVIRYNITVTVNL